MVGIDFIGGRREASVISAETSHQNWCNGDDEVSKTAELGRLKWREHS